MPTAKARSTPSRARPERLEARLSREQKELLQRAADLQGRTLTDFVLASAQEAARRTIAELGTIRLNAEESRAFAEAILAPGEPADRLRMAARRHLAMAG